MESFFKNSDLVSPRFIKNVYKKPVFVYKIALFVAFVISGSFYSLHLFLNVQGLKP